MPITQLSAYELQEKLRQADDLLLLDVREPIEFKFARIEGSTLMPLNSIPGRITELNSGRETVLICHHGVRSMQAAQFLQRNGFTHLYNLSGGIDAWSLMCDSNVPRY